MLDARKAPQMVMAVADDFAAEVHALCRIEIGDSQRREFLLAHLPPSDTPRSQTHAAELRRLWNYDERVSPWRGTAWGVVQAVSTYTHHYGTVRRASRAERNLGRAVTSKNEALDRSTITTLDKVLASPDHTPIAAPCRTRNWSGADVRSTATDLPISVVRPASRTVLGGGFT